MSKCSGQSFTGVGASPAAASATSRCSTPAPNAYDGGRARRPPPGRWRAARRRVAPGTRSATIAARGLEARDDGAAGLAVDELGALDAHLVAARRRSSNGGRAEATGRRRAGRSRCRACGPGATICSATRCSDRDGRRELWRGEESGPCPLSCGGARFVTRSALRLPAAEHRQQRGARVVRARARRSPRREGPRPSPDLLEVHAARLAQVEVLLHQRDLLGRQRALEVVGHELDELAAGTRGRQPSICSSSRLRIADLPLCSSTRWFASLIERTCTPRRSSAPRRRAARRRPAAAAAGPPSHRAAARASPSTRAGGGAPTTAAAG